MKNFILYSIVLLSSCGFNGTQKIDIDDTKQDVVVSGETYSYIVVRLEFFETIVRLCEDSNIMIEDEKEYRKAVADCSFDRLSLLNVNLDVLTQFDSAFCSSAAEDQTLTAEEKLQIEQACSLLQTLNQ